MLHNSLALWERVGVRVSCLAESGKLTAQFFWPSTIDPRPSTILQLLANGKRVDGARNSVVPWLTTNS